MDFDFQRTGTHAHLRQLSRETRHLGEGEREKERERERQREGDQEKEGESVAPADMFAKADASDSQFNKCAADTRT